MNNPYRDDKIINDCSIFGIMDQSGKVFSGREITEGIANMHDRGNGLGGGFAVYGIYPDYKDYYAFHIMYLSETSKSLTEDYLGLNFRVVFDEEIATRKTKKVVNPPLVWRYFVDVEKPDLAEDQAEEDFVIDKVMTINTGIEGAFVFSSGKDMGVFKGVGFPEEISEYFMLEKYNGYLWTAHGRFPTNTQGWWGGAHPFSILDWTVVHNGEISSYGINKRHLEMFGYHCTMHTDTEVMAYAVDLLMRKHGLPVELFAAVLAPPLWSEIDRLGEEEKKVCTALRQVYGSLLANGPFTVIIANHGQMIGLTDRIRLRPLVAGSKSDLVFLSSEEAPIKLVCPDVEKTWIPMGGEPVIGALKADHQTRFSGRSRNKVVTVTP